jgi:diguanylate cyclase (GGDEF)-like protein
VKRIIVIRGTESELFPLRDATKIGSGQENDIRIASAGVPERFCVINVSPAGGFVIEACRGVESITVNGNATKRRALAEGDMISIGDAVILVGAEEVNDDAVHVSTVAAADGGSSEIIARQSADSAPEELLGRVLKLNEAHQKLTTLHRLGLVLSGSLDLNHIVNRIMDAAMDVFAADRAFVLLADSTGRRLLPAGVRTRKEQVSPPRMSRSILREVVKRREYLLYTDAAFDAALAESDSVMGQEVRSAMSGPLLFANRLIGVLHVDNAKTGVFADEDLGLFSGFAMHAANAVGNAVQYQKVVKHDADMRRVMQAVRSLGGLLGETYLTREVVKRACGLFKAQRCSLFLLNRDGKKARLAFALGMEQGIWSQCVVEPGKGLCGAVLAAGKPLLVEDARTHSPKLKLLRPEKYQSSSFMIAPLTPPDIRPDLAESVMGALCITDKLDGGPFTQSESEMLVFLCNHVAMALKAARQFERLAMDPGTGLMNPAFFASQLQDRLDGARQQARPVGVVVIRIEGFRNYAGAADADATGKVMGEIGRALITAIQHSDFAGRPRPDCFAVVLTVATVESAAIAAVKLGRAVIHVLQRKGVSKVLNVKAASGMFSTGDADDCIDELLDNTADIPRRTNDETDRLR